MAKQDWKRVTTNKSQISWQNMKNNDYLTITKRFHKQGKWGVHSEKGGVIATDQTKTSALDYTKGYMRTH